ncbi:MAG: hypothetical protein MZV63_57495 [Marinilabiliales bacterium]|nr:hypothetical protein [Marinilabiliales bacterium]
MRRIMRDSGFDGQHDGPEALGHGAPVQEELHHRLGILAVQRNRVGGALVGYGVVPAQGSQAVGRGQAGAPGPAGTDRLGEHGAVFRNVDNEGFPVEADHLIRGLGEVDAEQAGSLVPDGPQHGGLRRPYGKPGLVVRDFRVAIGDAGKVLLGGYDFSAGRRRGQEDGNR